MKTSDHVKRVIVYGDSFTYGKQSGVNARLAPSVRYTGVLQSLLGGDVDVIEEGLRGRNLFGENPFFPDRDGLASFGPIIGSHLPADVLVILLGTNDCNDNPDFDPAKHAGALHEYMAKLKSWAEFLGAGVPKVLLVMPPDIDESVFNDQMRTIFGADANERLTLLRKELQKVAAELGLPVLDASHYCKPAPQDGIHLDAENNRKLAEALHPIVTELLA